MTLTNTETAEVPKDVIDAANRFADLYGDGKQGYAAFDIAVFAILAERRLCIAACMALAEHTKAKGEFRESFTAKFLAGQIEAGNHVPTPEVAA